MLAGKGKYFKDARVERILEQHGVRSHRIFFSPIKIWVIYLFVICCMGIGLLMTFWEQLISLNVLWGIMIACLLYVPAAYVHNSFVMDQGKLWVVNPNFPFRSCESFLLEDIQHAEIWTETRLKFLEILLLEPSFLGIQTAERRRRFYCSSLERDSFEGANTKLTLDDLGPEFKRHNIPVTHQD